MEYERIQKPSPQGGGISPGKLRFMLLGVEKRRKEEEELESRFALRSEAAAAAAEIDDRRASLSETCKDVDIVSSLPPECSTSSEMMSGSGARSKDHGFSGNTRGTVRSQDEDSVSSDGVSSAAFEFQRAERAAFHRPAIVPPFSKPAPSKWDDAQKWIASPTSNRHGKGGGQTRRTGFLGYGSRQSTMTKVVVEVNEEPDTKRIDPNQEKKEVVGQKSVNCVPDPYPATDSYTKPALFVENLTEDSAISLSQHDSSTSVQSATAFVSPPSTVRSVSMRDMGTEMTPIASQEPSRTGTPVRATTPIRSPNTSSPSSPGRFAPSSTLAESADAQAEANKELSEKELKMKTRREIMLLGTKLGKMNIAAWASKEEEDKDASASLKALPAEPPEKRVIEVRAAAWEEAEKAKYLARYKREEIKIQAWENHQKAKAEAEMRKIEVVVERTRGRAHDRLVNKLAAARHKAEGKRAAAEAERNRQAAITARQADYIRRTGEVPSSFSCWSWCS